MIERFLWVLLVLLVVSVEWNCYYLLIHFEPPFPFVRLFIAVLSAFFQTAQPYALFTSMFHAFKSSVTVALHVLQGLTLPLKPSISKLVHVFVHLSLLSTYPYHLRRFNINFDSKGARFYRPYIVDRLTLCSAFIFSIQHNIAGSLRKRCCICSLCRGQHLLSWSKVPLTQLSYNFPCLTKEIVVNIRRGSSSQNFLHAAPVCTIVTSSQPPPGQILPPR